MNKTTPLVNLSKATKTQLTYNSKYLRISMLSFVVKQLKTRSPLRTNRNCIAQLSIANPRIWDSLHGVRPEHEPSGQTSRLPITTVQQQHTQCFKKCFRCGKQSSQLKTSELCSSTEWITRILTGVKIGALSQMVIATCHLQALQNTYCCSHFIPAFNFQCFWKCCFSLY